jgi:pseudaminic acid cytidylyltransferase
MFNKTKLTSVENIAIITARAGSQRIKNKNIKFFFGKPVIAYSIKCALKSKLFSRVIVSTDSKKIKKISLSYGAEVPFKRPKKISNSSSGTVSVIRHAIRKMKLTKKNLNICCVYPVTPFVNLSLLKKTFLIFKKKKIDFLLPMSKCKNYNEAKFFSLNKNGHLTKNIKNKNLFFKDTGQFYWGKSASWLKNESVFSGKTVPFIVSNKFIDVNTEEDWKNLERKFKKKK